MQVSRQAEQLPGVEAAAAVAATPVNLKLLARQGFAIDPAGLGPSDLVVCVRAADEETADQAMEQVAALLAGSSGGTSGDAGAGPVAQPRSLRAAARRHPDLNLAVLSVPGRHLHYEITQALQAGLHVFCFSDGLDPAAEACCSWVPTAAPPSSTGSASASPTPSAGARSGWSAPPAPASRRSPACWTTPGSASPTPSAWAAATSPPRSAAS